MHCVLLAGTQTSISSSMKLEETIGSENLWMITGFSIVTFFSTSLDLVFTPIYKNSKLEY